MHWGTSRAHWCTGRSRFEREKEGRRRERDREREGEGGDNSKGLEKIKGKGLMSPGRVSVISRYSVLYTAAK